MSVLIKIIMLKHWYHVQFCAFLLWTKWSSCQISMINFQWSHIDYMRVRNVCPDMVSRCQDVKHYFSHLQFISKFIFITLKCLFVFQIMSVVFSGKISNIELYFSPSKMFCTVRGLSSRVEPAPPCRLKPRSLPFFFRNTCTCWPETAATAGQCSHAFWF